MVQPAWSLLARALTLTWPVLWACANGCSSAPLIIPAGNDGAAAECAASSECVLIARGCCSACEPTVDDVLAVPRRAQQAEQAKVCPSQVACGPCEIKPYDPTRPHPIAACESGQCVTQDLRALDSSACATDADCELHSAGCCPGCGADPSGWVALKQGEDHPVTCDPIPPCAPCSDDLRPVPFCATDGHCAVRQTTVD